MRAVHEGGASLLQRRSSGRRPTVTAASPSGCAALAELGLERTDCPSQATAPRPRPAATRPGTRFIFGAPMKPATKRFAGRS